jgi:hypothetical protein
MSCFKVLSRHYPRGTGDNENNDSRCIAPDWIVHLPNTSRSAHFYSKMRERAWVKLRTASFRYTIHPWKDPRFGFKNGAEIETDIMQHVSYCSGSRSATFYRVDPGSVWGNAYCGQIHSGIVVFRVFIVPWTNNITSVHHIYLSRTLMFSSPSINKYVTIFGQIWWVPRHTWPTARPPLRKLRLNFNFKVNLRSIS